MESIFVDAEQGGIVVSQGPGNTLKHGDGTTVSKTPLTLAILLKENGLLGREVYFCSSMDFAEEYGFSTHDGAKLLWEKMKEYL